MSEKLPPVGAAGEKDKSGLAIGALVCGIVSLCAWLLPFCGGPIGLAGVVLGIMGMKSSKRTMAIAGLIMGAIGILLTIINAVAGALLLPFLGEFDINQYLPQ